MELQKEEGILSRWIKKFQSYYFIAKYEMLIDDGLLIIDRWWISDKFRKVVEFFFGKLFL